MNVNFDAGPGVYYSLILGGSPKPDLFGGVSADYGDESAGSPATVWVNNINHDFAKNFKNYIPMIVGTIGAHELIHKITSIKDLPIDPNNLSDIMTSNAQAAADRANGTYNASTRLLNNGYTLSQKEIDALRQACLGQRKH